ncbi:MAG: ATP-binding cassette domain-containing protein [Pirellulales bacterium]
MALVTLRELSVGFRGPPLLDQVSCQIEVGHRIGLLGRNGSGKTTLMRILCGEVVPDGGRVDFSPGTRVALLPQDVPQDLTGCVSDVVASGLSEGNSPSVADGDHHETAWRSQQQVERILSRMELDGAARFETLSSGMKRRILLARTLVSDPDLLLLDEPTNHLDIEAIGWLEDFLARWTSTLIFVTHDRMFLSRLSNRILEIDRGRLFDWSCDYDTFLVRKQAALAAEEKQQALFDKRLAQEETWIRQGIKARRTRNEGRVRALEQMRRQRGQRRPKNDTARIQIDAGERSGRLVAEIEGIHFAYDDREIVGGFTTTIMRGDRIGMMGPNGAGKTTLLRLLLGQLEPQQGTVRLGTNLRIAYFDQLRDQLDDEATVQENVGDGYDSVNIGGRSRHIIGYLQDFLFTPQRSQTLVRYLSGGERNRVLLAKLFSKPANVIVLDEPTNDLDSETLELLEERLSEFEGTVLLVSHDRAFLNNLVTSTIVFEEEGIQEYVGGYDDWLRQRRQRTEEVTRAASQSERVVRRVKKANGGTSSEEKGSGTKKETTRRRLGYNEQRELATLPAAIEQFESEIAALHAVMADAGFYRQSSQQITDAQARLEELEDRRNATYHRWEELEGQAD